MLGAVKIMLPLPLFANHRNSNATAFEQTNQPDFRSCYDAHSTRQDMIYRLHECLCVSSVDCLTATGPGKINGNPGELTFQRSPIKRQRLSSTRGSMLVAIPSIGQWILHSLLMHFSSHSQYLQDHSFHRLHGLSGHGHQDVY